jgi:hypothetical protein
MVFAHPKVHPPRRLTYLGLSGIRRSGSIDDGDSWRGLKAELGVGDRQILLPISEAILQFDAARLEYLHISQLAGFGIHFQIDLVEVTAGVGDGGSLGVSLSGATGGMLLTARKTKQHNVSRRAG